jgi:AraC family transcriptional regulator of adaptative response / DNA-3-methyladenine glycosylase II
MVLDADAAYLALQARDARFDGRLFVGVTSTGIYCRPVCRVRTPRRAHCRFFDSAAQAEAASFRPCLKCRPEIAPGLSAMDSSRTLAAAAARAIEHAVAGGEAAGVEQVAARLGVTGRHLRRIFRDSHGVGPHEYLTTQRLLLAKRLLTDTAEPVAQVALASGFASLRRFNAAFAERYRMPPSRLRRASGDDAGDRQALRLAWRPPYDVDALLAFVERRQIPSVEQVWGQGLRRTLGWRHQGRRIAGWIDASFDLARHELRLRVSPSLAPVLGAVIERVRHGFDLDADPALIDPALARLPLPAHRGLRVPGAFDGFEAAVRVVLGQQVSVAAARTLAARLVARFGEPVETGWPALTRLFPTPEAIAGAGDDDLGRLGIVRSRAQALRALATAVADGGIELHRGAPLEATLRALRAVPGLGEWSVQLIALRSLGWPDAWPAGDAAALKALGTREHRRADHLAEACRPWRGYALMRLWHHLENP